MTQRLLFLYTAPETGHQKAAEAIIQAVSQMNPHVECIPVDAGSYASPILNKVFNRVYLEMIEKMPVIWDYLYDNPDVVEFTKEARGLLTSFSQFRTRKILKKYHPEAVVCTQAVPATMMAASKRKGILKIPLICVITDFAVHAYWYHQEVDLYLVAHEEIRQQMIRKGIHPERIRITGIPIHPRFGDTLDATGLRSRLHLHPQKKTVLVMGGSHGLGSLDQTVEALKNIPLNFQTLVICGRNRKLYNRVLKITEDMDDCHVYGYVKDLSHLMGAADLLITKPGGLTVSEALAMKLPLVLTNPIPGQEERNVEFLTRHQVAKLARSPEDLVHTVTDLLRNPKKLNHLKQRTRLLARPYSAWEASRLIFSLAADAKQKRSWII